MVKTIDRKYLNQRVRKYEPGNITSKFPKMFQPAETIKVQNKRPANVKGAQFVKDNMTTKIKPTKGGGKLYKQKQTFVSNGKKTTIKRTINEKGEIQKKAITKKPKVKMTQRNTFGKVVKDTSIKGLSKLKDIYVPQKDPMGTVMTIIKNPEKIALGMGTAGFLVITAPKNEKLRALHKQPPIKIVRSTPPRDPNIGDKQMMKMLESSKGQVQRFDKDQVDPDAKWQHSPHLQMAKAKMKIFALEVAQTAKNKVYTPAAEKVGVTFGIPEIDKPKKVDDILNKMSEYAGDIKEVQESIQKELTEHEVVDKMKGMFGSASDEMKKMIDKKYENTDMTTNVLQDEWNQAPEYYKNMKVDGLAIAFQRISKDVSGTYEDTKWIGSVREDTKKHTLEQIEETKNVANSQFHSTHGDVTVQSSAKAADTITELDLEAARTGQEVLDMTQNMGALEDKNKLYDDIREQKVTSDDDINKRKEEILKKYKRGEYFKW